MNDALQDNFSRYKPKRVKNGNIIITARRKNKNIHRGELNGAYMALRKNFLPAGNQSFSWRSFASDEDVII